MRCKLLASVVLAFLVFVVAASYAPVNLFAQSKVKGSGKKAAGGGSLTRGLLTVRYPIWVTGLGGSPADVNGNPSNGEMNANGPTWLLTRVGNGIRHWQDSVNDAGDRLVWNTGPFTFTSWFYIDVQPSASECGVALQALDYVSESNNRGYRLMGCGAIGGARNNKFVCDSFNNNGTANYSLVSTSTVAVGLWMVTCTSDGTTRRIYVNGVEEASTTNSPVPADCTNTDLCRWGGEAATTGRLYNLMLGAWNRLLAENEIRALSNDPTSLGDGTIDPVFLQQAGGYPALLNNPVVIQ